MDETKLSTSKHDSTTLDDIFLVAQDHGNMSRLSVNQLEPNQTHFSRVGETHFLWSPSVVLSCAGSIFCLGDENGAGCIQEYDCLSQIARQPTQLENTVCRTASAASSQEIMVTGGLDSHVIANTCHVYALATNRWMTLSELNQPRFGHQMCWLPNGKVFAIGGSEESSDLTSVEMLERACTSAVSSKASGRILVAGGFSTNQHPSSIVEIFEPPNLKKNIGQWTTLTNLAYPVSGSSLVQLSSDLLLIDTLGEMQCGRLKAQVTSDEYDRWTWTRCRLLNIFDYCWGLVSISSNTA